MSLRILVPSSGGSGTPGGSNTQIQYNNAGAFGGTSTVTWDGTNLTIALLIVGTSETFPDSTVQITAYPGNNPLMAQVFS